MRLSLLVCLAIFLLPRALRSQCRPTIAVENNPAIVTTPKTARLTLTYPCALTPINTDPGTIQPQLRAFLNFGDGAYEHVTLTRARDGQSYSADILHTFRAESPEADAVSYPTEGTLVAIYSPDRPPKVRIIGTPTPGSVPPSTAFKPFKGLRSVVMFKAPWPMSYPDSTVQLGLSYRGVVEAQDTLLDAPNPDQQGLLNGRIILRYDTRHFTFERVLKGGQIPTLNNTLTAPGVVVWDFAGLRRGELRSFFVEIKAKHDIVSRENPLVTSILSTELQIATFDDQQTPVTIQSAQPLKYVTYNANGLAGQYEGPITLASSLDPNNVEFTPRCLAPRKSAQKVRATVNFQNTGAAPATGVRITSTIDAQRLAPGRDSVEYFPTERTIYAATENTPVFTDALTGDGKALLLDQGTVDAAQRNGTPADSVTLLRLTGGFVRYLVEAKPNLADGDSITVRALIVMDSDTLPAQATLPVSCRCLNHLRWKGGVKLFRAFEGTANLRDGWGGRLTLRRAISPIDFDDLADPARQRRALPEWWLQWEAGVSRLHLTNEVPSATSYRLWYLDLTPVQVLFAPRFPASNRRWLGLAAGYTASVRLSAAPVATRFDRVEHTFEGSVYLLDVLGKRGLSVGATYGVRRSGNAAYSERWFGYPTVFLHYNLY